MRDEILEALERLYEELSRESIELLIERLPQADPYKYAPILKLFYNYDGLRDALLRLGQAELGKKLAESSIEFVEKLLDKAKIVLAFLHVFRGEMVGRERIKDLKRALEILKEVRYKDEYYAPIYLRAGISLVKRLDSNGKREEAVKEAIRLVRELKDEDLKHVEGDANALVMLATLSKDLPEDSLKDVKEFLERIGFVRGDALKVPTFVAAMFRKDLSVLAKRLGLRIVARSEVETLIMAAQSSPPSSSFEVFR